MKGHRVTQILAAAALTSASLAAWTPGAAAQGRPAVLKPVHLVVWVPDSSTQNPIFEAAVNAFNRKYAKKHLSASVQFFTWSDYPQKLTVAMSSGVGPDILYNGAAATAGLVASKEVVPLNRYLASDPQVKGIVKGYEKQTYYRGKSWFVPVDAGALVLGYRKDLFKAAHLPLPHTWAQLLKDAVKLAIPNHREGIALGTSGIAFEQDLSVFLYDDGGNFVNSAGTKATTDSKAAIQSLSLYQKFFKEGAASVKFVPTTGQDPLGDGQAAMEFAPSLPTIQKYDPKVYHQIGFMPVPPGPLSKKSATYAAANGFYISADSKHAADAWLLLEQYLKDSGSIARGLGVSPVLKADEHAPWIEKNPELKAMYRAMGEMRLQGNPNIPAWVTAVRGDIYTVGQGILYGRSVAQVARTMTQEIQSALNSQG